MRLSGLLDDQVDRGRKAHPGFQFLFQLLAAGAGERVELCHPAGLGGSPLGLDPGLLLQTMERRVEGPLLNLKSFPGNLLDALGDGPAVLGLVGDGPEDQQVERSLDEIGGLGHMPRLTTTVDNQ